MQEVDAIVYLLFLLYHALLLPRGLGGDYVTIRVLPSRFFGEIFSWSYRECFGEGSFDEELFDERLFDETTVLGLSETYGVLCDIDTAFQHANERECAEEAVRSAESGKAFAKSERVLEGVPASCTSLCHARFLKPLTPWLQPAIIQQHGSY